MEIAICATKTKMRNWCEYTINVGCFIIHNTVTILTTLQLEISYVINYISFLLN